MEALIHPRQGLFPSHLILRVRHCRQLSLLGVETVLDCVGGDESPSSLLFTFLFFSAGIALVRAIWCGFKGRKLFVYHLVNSDFKIATQQYTCGRGEES